MSENKKPYSYYEAVVSNSLKNEYRANDNAGKHIAFYDTLPERETSDAMIENELVQQEPESWLMFIENPRLHMALSVLTPEELELVYMLMERRYTQAQLAAHYGISQQTISKKYKCIIGNLKKMLAEEV